MKPKRILLKTHLIKTMKIKLLFLFFVLVSPFLMAQDIQRVKIEGIIHVPEGDDAEGIGIYNISSQKGAVTDEEGKFIIEAAENDRLQIYALQYQSFVVVVDKGIIERRKTNIYLNPAITQLDEVIIRPYDLTGNVQADVKKIPTYQVGNNWDMSFEAMEFGYGFTPDPQSSINQNVAQQALNPNMMNHGANILGLMGGVANLLFPRKEGKITVAERKDRGNLISNNLQVRFSKKFVEDNFDIPEDKAVEFLIFAQENGLDRNLLKPENELELMQFLQQSSLKFKSRME